MAVLALGVRSELFFGGPLMHGRKAMRYGKIWKLASDHTLPRLFVSLRGVIAHTRSDGWMVQKSIFSDECSPAEMEPLLLPSDFQYPLLDLDVCLAQDGDRTFCIVALDSNNGVFVVHPEKATFLHQRLSPHKEGERATKIMAVGLTPRLDFNVGVEGTGSFGRFNRILAPSEFKVVCMTDECSVCAFKGTFGGGMDEPLWHHPNTPLIDRIMKCADSIYVGVRYSHNDQCAYVHVAGGFSRKSFLVKEESGQLVSPITHSAAFIYHSTAFITLLYCDDIVSRVGDNQNVHVGSQGIISAPLISKRIPPPVAGRCEYRDILGDGPVLGSSSWSNGKRSDLFISATKTLLRYGGTLTEIHCGGYSSINERGKRLKKPNQ